VVDSAFDVNKETGDVLWFQRMRVTVDDPEFNLRNFPFDVEDLCISIRFPRHIKQRIRGIRGDIMPFIDEDYQETARLSQATTEAVNEEYDVLKIARDVSRGPGGIAHYIELSTAIHIARKSYFWIWSVVLPNLMLSMIGIMVFLITPNGNGDFFSDRASLLVTVVLTSIAFQFTVAAALPSLPYLTTLDRWRNMLNFLFLLSAIECAYLQVLRTPTP